MLFYSKLKGQLLLAVLWDISECQLFPTFCFWDNNLLLFFHLFDICAEFFGNKADSCVSVVVFDKCGRSKVNIFSIVDKDSYIFACFKIFARNCNKSFSPFHSTFAPKFSAIKQAGSIVRSFTILGATLFDVYPNSGVCNADICGIL